ncbi:spondin-1-like isoform X2 [Leptopilina heterotoma]|uniref:spondin-1-like isoform X2 n=1 Tax=Leptopilina heterotoma TaxID=63436 RepID=UPI001CA86876|nr:spondin-1-like isoform X2 [Leptopilina heterotoma]
MTKASISIGLIIFLSSIISGLTLFCNHIPPHAFETPRTPLEDEFQIVMSNVNRTDYFQSYMPRTNYMLTIESGESQGPAHKFSSFFIIVSNENETLDSGTLIVIDETLSKYSEKCENAIIETAKLPKESVSIIWRSPIEDSGCVRIRALVVETPETWYMEDDDANEKLSLRMCPNPKAEEDEQGEILDKCCACDEAKYEVAFEGLWSRNTHPKDFPSKAWLARFSDVIGASHTAKYRFWSYNGNASEGLKQVAEHGSTRVLESELKDQSEHIRTIIKARGISYPNVTGKTFAVFRVDRMHHLMSLVSMIDPSPDWFVGVSGLELCLSNCTWIEHKQYNLYPYDAGTDEGITYLADDVPTIPQQSIRRITTSYPNDSGSPFFDPFNSDMKPMAKLHINRQRIYEKVCEGMQQKPSNSEACRMTPWGDWGPCSVQCGQGTSLRQRHFVDNYAATKTNCKDSQSDRKICYGGGGPCEMSAKDAAILNSKECELEQWSQWSECSSTCAPSVQARKRIFIHKKHQKHCRNVSKPPRLEQTRKCDLPACEQCEEEPCEEVRTSLEPTDIESVTETTTESNDDPEDDDNEGDDDSEEEVEIIEEWREKCPNSRFSAWSIWTPCSSSCGPGVMMRSRIIEKNVNNVGEEVQDSEDEEDNLQECTVQQAACTAKIESCNYTVEEAEEICLEPKDPGTCSGNIIRLYYDKDAGECKHFSYSGCEGTRNNFPTAIDCEKVCKRGQKDTRTNHSSSVKHFQVSISSVLSYHIPVQEQRSPKSKRARSGSDTTPDEFNGLQTGSQVIEATEEYRGKVDCEVSDWSPWSECLNCHDTSYRIREVTVKRQNKGRKCPKLAKYKKCSTLPECASKRNGMNIRRRSKDDLPLSGNYNDEEESVDCQVSQWSRWSRCSATCGDSVQYRTKTIKIQPKNRGQLCPPLVEFRDCSKPQCPSK